MKHFIQPHDRTAAPQKKRMNVASSHLPTIHSSSPSSLISNRSDQTQRASLCVRFSAALIKSAAFLLLKLKDCETLVVVSGSELMQIFIVRILDGFNRLNHVCGDKCLQVRDVGADNVKIL